MYLGKHCSLTETIEIIRQRHPLSWIEAKRSVLHALADGELTGEVLRNERGDPLGPKRWTTKKPHEWERLPIGFGPFPAGLCPEREIRYPRARVDALWPAPVAPVVASPAPVQATEPGAGPGQCLG